MPSARRLVVAQQVLWSGVEYKAASLRQPSLFINSLDVPLVLPMTPTSVPTPLVPSVAPITSVQGMAFNMYNNVWNTKSVQPRVQ